MGVVIGIDPHATLVRQTFNRVGAAGSSHPMWLILNVAVAVVPQHADRQRCAPSFERLVAAHLTTTTVAPFPGNA